MFGPSLLVAPILYPGARERKIYLPEGPVWKNTETGESFQGGVKISCDAPLNVIPVFANNDVDVTLNVSHGQKN